MEKLYKSIRDDLALRDAAGLPQKKSELWGISGASEQRMGGLYKLMDQPHRAQEEEAFRTAQDDCRRGMEIDPANHRVVTQYLSFCAVSTICKNQQDVAPEDHHW